MERKEGIVSRLLLDRDATSYAFITVLDEFTKCPHLEQSDRQVSVISPVPRDIGLMIATKSLEGWIIMLPGNGHVRPSWSE